MGLAALQHVGSSQSRDRTSVSCIGRWMLFFFFWQVDSLPLSHQGSPPAPWILFRLILKGKRVLKNFVITMKTHSLQLTSVLCFICFIFESCLSYLFFVCFSGSIIAFFFFFFAFCGFPGHQSHSPSHGIPPHNPLPRAPWSVCLGFQTRCIAFGSHPGTPLDCSSGLDTLSLSVISFSLSRNLLKHAIK